MACHRAVKQASEPIRALAALPRDAKPLPQHRKLADFVFFSHARHADAKVACADCHGAASDTLEPRVEVKMKFCVDCHRTRHASSACTICHELSQ